MTWEAKALCQFLPASWWDTDRPHIEAIRVCLACPVASRCLNDAMSAVTRHEWDTGIRAATTPDDREAIRRGRTGVDAAWTRAGRLVWEHDARVREDLDAMFLEQLHDLEAVA